MVQHRAKGQRGQLIQQPCAGIGQHMEGGVMGEGCGHAVQHIAQHPAARHPRAERQALRQLRRAVHKRGDDFNNDEIRDQRAGDAEQCCEDAQSVFAALAFRKLHQP